MQSPVRNRRAWREEAVGRAQWGEEGEAGERWRWGREDRVPRLQNLLRQAFIFLPFSLWLLATFLILQCVSWYRALLSEPGRSGRR